MSVVCSSCYWFVCADFCCWCCCVGVLFGFVYLCSLFCLLFNSVAVYVLRRFYLRYSLVVYFCVITTCSLLSFGWLFVWYGLSVWYFALLGCF